MSVLLELSIFPLDRGESLSVFVSPVVAMIRDSGLPYRLTAMGTIVETADIAAAMDLVTRAHELLEQLGSDRIYAAVKIDSRRGAAGRLTAKTDAVSRQIGEVAR
jgi:uncharacterized protein (TIGR00106 family)